MSKPLAMLTIDDAPSPDFKALLGILAEQDLKAIFFCTGEQMDAQRGLLLQALRAGHWLGNHAWDHRHFSELSLEEGLAQIDATEAVLAALRSEANCLQHPRIFRFPYGDKGVDNGERSMLQNTLRARGFQSPSELGVSLPQLVYPESLTLEDVDWLWGADSHDWSFGRSHETAERFAQEIHTRVPIIVAESGCEVLIFHDHPGNAELFRVVLPMLREQFAFHLPSIPCCTSDSGLQ